MVLNSGLEDEYTYLIDETVMPDSYYELASNVRLSAGDTLNRRGLLEADDEVCWRLREPKISRKARP